MYIQKTQKGLYYGLALPAVFVLLFIAGTWVFPNRSVWAADDQGEYQEYPDRAGREALRLWTERERDRAMAAAAQRYWDYWLLWPPRRYLWRPSYYSPYPYPPLYPYPYAYSYPYPYYYPPPYYAAPPMGPPPPYHVYPGVSENPKD